MNKRKNYSLAEMREYDASNQFERDIDWNKELKLYAIFSLLTNSAALSPDFGVGASILIPALMVCFLWNLLGRHEGILSALFRYLSVLTFLGWIGLAKAAVAIYLLFSLGWIIHSVFGKAVKTNGEK